MCVRGCGASCHVQPVGKTRSGGVEEDMSEVCIFVRMHPHIR